RQKRCLAFLLRDATQLVEPRHPARMYLELGLHRGLGEQPAVARAELLGLLATTLAAVFGAVFAVLRLILPVFRPVFPLLPALLASLLAFFLAFLAFLASASGRRLRRQRPARGEHGERGQQNDELWLHGHLVQSVPDAARAFNWRTSEAAASPSHGTESGPA